jgi:ubiquinone/menaquinone biosynthesis C-methylase UbiE
VPESRPYYAERGLSARYYDLLTSLDGTLEGDVELYAGLAPPGGSILELGCGTGRLAVALARLGFSVEGLDIAPAMLQQAQSKVSALDAGTAGRIRLRQGDMAALNLDRRFDAVICAFFGLAHLPAGAAWRNVFRGMARHLKSTGRCAVHLPLVELMARPDPVDSSRPVMRTPTGEAGRTLELFVRERSFRPAIGRMDQVFDYVVTNAAGAVEHRSFERQTFYAADPVPFARDAGLVLDRPAIRLGAVGDVFVFRPE